MAASAVAMEKLVSPVSSVGATRLADAGHAAGLGEALGGVKLPILLMG